MLTLCLIAWPFASIALGLFIGRMIANADREMLHCNEVITLPTNRDEVARVVKNRIGSGRG